MKKPLIYLMLLCLLSTASVLSSNGQNKQKQSQDPKVSATVESTQKGGPAQNLKAPSDGGCNWRPSGRTRYNFYLGRAEEELVAYCTLNLFTGYQSQWVALSAY